MGDVDGGKMNEDIIIITTEGCVACSKLKSSKIIDNYGNDIKPKFLDIQKSDEAVEIVLDKNVKEVPVVFSKSNDGLKKCSLKYDDEQGVSIVKCG